jgi:adenylate cyclase
MGFVGFRPSRKNPLWCSRCFEEAPLGGAEVEVAALFADVRGYTSLSTKMSPEQAAELISRFYAAATDVLIRHDAVIDKLVGDQVVALFIPGMAKKGHVRECADAAEQLLQAVGSGGEPWLPIGVGLDVGVAFVGNVGSGDVKDFTAIGDVMNTAARLQSQAARGQIVMSERLHERVPGRFPDARPVELELKGKSEPVAAYVVDLTTPAAAPGSPASA